MATIQEAVKKIIELRGLDIFKNPKQFFALLGDLSPEYPKELRIIKNNFDEKLMGLFIDDTKKVRHRLRLIKDQLEDFGFADDKVYFFLESFGIPLGWEQEIYDLKADCPTQTYIKPQQNQPTTNASVTDVTLNDDVLKQLGFMDKNSIPSVFNIPSTYKPYSGITYRIVKIDDNVFKDCANLKTVTIPDTVTEIGNSSFKGCIALEKINIPDSVIKIGDRAFANCKNLDIFIIPDSVVEIGLEAFGGCSKLRIFTLPTKYTIFKDDVNRQIDFNLPASTSSVTSGAKLATATNTASPFKNVKVGEYIKFGSYPQTLNGDIQPIEWQVLSKENNKILVISRYGLDAKRFDDSSSKWQNSEIRKWLNGDFYNSAFSADDKKYINLSNLSDVGTSDNVFLLSKGEAGKYFSNDEARKCKATEYAKKNGAYVRNGYIFRNGYILWWLRSPSPISSISVYRVRNDGFIYDFSVNLADVVVRPALWINL